MNEGKPAKADGPALTPDEVTDASGAARGGAAAAEPSPMPMPMPTGAPADAGPGARAADRVGAAGSVEVADSDGDFALRSPHIPLAEPEGDYELRAPEPVPEPAPEPAPEPVPEPAPEPAPEPVVKDAPGRPAERPRPLHDPDPYSTPPYGGPGPWAPAPPVQHPTSPAPEPTPAPAVATPALAPAPSGEAPPSPTPWQNYDPWAPATGPLQQTGAAVASRDQRRKRVRRTLLGAAVLLAVVSGGVGGVVGTYLERNGGIGEVELPQAAAEPAGRAPDSVAGIAARALPGVVTLHVNGSAEQGTGTGFVLDARGHILTNNHVVEPAGSDGEISVTFSSGDTAEATVVGRDSGYDLAVVKVRGVSGLQPVPLGNSDNVQVGDPVVAIGAPFDLEGTVTSGIISAKERPITAGGEDGEGSDGSDVSYVDALQTDAPINPGNSGGPLLDARARVIGINSAIRSADSGADLDGGQAGSIGLGFAIPINQGKRVAEELINTGRATHPVIGVTLDMDYTGDGARVDTRSADGGPAVTVGGPGARAGIKAGDVITEVDGRPVHSGEELIVKTRAHRPGDRLELTLERAGKERTLSLVLGSAAD
ncbi:trypsin-like peptidase domain-containing protein [Streptomyces sp. NPDC050997]|uniref:S1C family serine protease n=1 Tax=Streptomyces sp. NPDC050997 TaxID=3155519 RepID=UPI00342D5EB7